jgi:DNA modification methylase
MIPRPIHPFPARMAGSIPWEVLEATNRTRLRVLDPMVGSGTTVVVARTLGHEALGFDTDPLAVMIAQAWCDDVDEAAVRRRAKRVLAKAKESASGIYLRDAYPHNADDETRAFTRYWFDGTNRRQLTALAAGIRATRNAGVRRLLWCAFSRLIITKQASAAMALDVAHSRPHRVTDRKPIRPLHHFGRSVETVLKATPFFSGKVEHPTASIEAGDARNLPVEDASVDIVITSPPYLNAIDYLRGHKFSLAWMGYPVSELREVRATNIGTEVTARERPQDPVVTAAMERMGDVDQLSTRERGQLARYVGDMNLVMRTIRRVLKPGGSAVLVVGDTTRRRVFIRNSDALVHLGALHGLDLIQRAQRALPPNRRYLPPPSTESRDLLDGRLRDEVVLTLKSGA